MRVRIATYLTTALVGAMALTACGGGGGGGASSPKGPPAPVTFTLSSPEVDVQSGQEVNYCYFTHLPTTGELFIKQWNSTFTPGVVRAAVWFASLDVKPVGTMTLTECPFGAALATAGLFSWTYTATRSGEQFVFPDDDGNGRPVGMRANAGQPVIVWIHMLNTTADVIRPHVDITGVTYPSRTSVTRAESFAAEMFPLTIPPNSEKSFLQSCGLPVGAKFFSMTMYTNYKATAMAIRSVEPNGGIDHFEKSYPNFTDLNPGVKRFAAPAFATFANDQMTYGCTFRNNTNLTVTPGQSPQFEEHCLGLTLFFPATEPLACVGNVPIP